MTTKTKEQAKAEGYASFTKPYLLNDGNEKDERVFFERMLAQMNGKKYVLVELNKSHKTGQARRIEFWTPRIPRSQTLERQQHKNPCKVKTWNFTGTRSQLRASAIA